MDLFQEDDKTAPDQVEDRNIDLNLEDEVKRRAQQQAATKDQTVNPEEDQEDNQEVMMSMAPGVGQNKPEMAATLKFKNKKKEDAKLEDFQIIRMVGKGTFGKVFMVQHVVNK